MLGGQVTRIAVRFNRNAPVCSISLILGNRHVVTDSASWHETERRDISRSSEVEISDPDDNRGQYTMYHLRERFDKSSLAVILEFNLRS